MRKTMLGALTMFAAVLVAEGVAGFPVVENTLELLRLDAPSRNIFVAVSATRYPCSAAGISAAIRATAQTAGGSVDASNCPGPLSIDSNLWAGVVTPGKIVLGPGIFTISASQIIPSNWDISGSGFQTILQVAAATSLPNATKNAVFINSNYRTYTASAGHNAGISIHDMTLDGNSSRNGGYADQGIVLAGSDGSHVYNLHVRNFTNSCVDLRDGDDNVVESDWGVNCGATPNQWHAFGGGALLANGLFRHNTFMNNHAIGGMGDHYDLFGQGTPGNCATFTETGACAEQNIISGNTSDTPGTTCIFLDTTAKTVVSGNVCRFARDNGIAITSGAGSQGATGNTVSANVVVSAAQNGILIGNVSNLGAVIGNTIDSPGQDGIRLQDVGQTDVVGNVISGPGQSTPAGVYTYSGIFLGPSPHSNTHTASNNIHGNYIADRGNHMRFGIYEAGINADGGTSVSNTVSGNHIGCGALSSCSSSAGSSGVGVQDSGQGNFEYGDVWEGAQYAFRAGGALPTLFYSTRSNCSSAASPAACESAPAGSVAVAAGTTTLVVNTTAVTERSQILLTFDSSIGRKLGIQCSNMFDEAYVTGRADKESFTITVLKAPATTPVCISYQIIN